jgi:hypothetical protein
MLNKPAVLARSSEMTLNALLPITQLSEPSNALPIEQGVRFFFFVCIV